MDRRLWYLTSQVEGLIQNQLHSYSDYSNEVSARWRLQKLIKEESEFRKGIPVNIIFQAYRNRMNKNLQPDVFGWYGEKEPYHGKYLDEDKFWAMYGYNRVKEGEICENPAPKDLYYLPSTASSNWGTFSALIFIGLLYGIFYLVMDIYGC